MDKAISALDTKLFDAYNHCDLKTFDSLLADDVEFYHDQGGVTLGRQKLTESIKNNICTGDTQRVLVRGSRPFRILAVEGTGDGIELGAPLGAGAASQIVTFRCRFTRAGDFKRQLQIKTSLQDGPLLVTVEGTATR